MNKPQSLQFTQVIKAPREKVFAAWTKPELLMQWWGPGEVICPEAHVDLRAGGAYRLANLHPDGRTTWISGSFEEVSPPAKLVYSWNVEAMAVTSTLVTVEFREHPEGTELVLKHENFAATEVRDMHLMGWGGCVDKLASLLEQRGEF